VNDRAYIYEKQLGIQHNKLKGQIATRNKIHLQLKIRATTCQDQL